MIFFFLSTARKKKLNNCMGRSFYQLTRLYKHAYSPGLFILFNLHTKHLDLDLLNGGQFIF